MLGWQAATVINTHFRCSLTHLHIILWGRYHRLTKAWGSQKVQRRKATCQTSYSSDLADVALSAWNLSTSPSHQFVLALYMPPYDSLIEAWVEAFCKVKSCFPILPEAVFSLCNDPCVTKEIFSVSFPRHKEASGGQRLWLFSAIFPGPGIR